MPFGGRTFAVATPVNREQPKEEEEEACSLVLAIRVPGVARFGILSRDSLRLIRFFSVRVFFIRKQCIRK